MKLSSNEIRKRFLEFFKERGHAVLPSASLVPENDPSVLFNTAGMQPLVPYLLGEKHPKGNRLVDVQKCVRTNDIEEVGDNTHFTFFEMLGNWSLGDYFKNDALNWSFEFLTSQEYGLGLDPKKLYVTVFEGDENAPKDSEAYKIWEEIFKKVGLIPEERIFWMGADDNWWDTGDSGPAGPDSEMFYDVSKDGVNIKNKEDFIAADSRQDIIEIWNDVFMEYEKKDGKVIGKLKNKNVDTGAGLERLTSILQEKTSAYDTDLFVDIIAFLKANTSEEYANCILNFRISADHIRAVIFMLADGVVPANKDRGYVLRKLIRRAIAKMTNLNFSFDKTEGLIDVVIDNYSEIYPELSNKRTVIINEIKKELKKFKRTLDIGMKEFEKLINTKVKNNNIKEVNFGEFAVEPIAVNELSADDVFRLYSTYGIPIEVIKEEAEKNNICIDDDGFKKKVAEHSKKSQTASAGMFKGGLGGDSPKIRALHTTTHLMLAGLRKFLGDGVTQAGSNITEERIRFDFTYPEKVDREILDKVEGYVNQVINIGATVKVTEMKKEQAKKDGVTGAFWEKYPDVVKVWTIEDGAGNIYSKELCGGPHAENTSDISKFGSFKIIKEKSSSAGVRRIKAILQ